MRIAQGAVLYRRFTFGGMYWQRVVTYLTSLSRQTQAHVNHGQLHATRWHMLVLRTADDAAGSPGKRHPPIAGNSQLQSDPLVTR